MINGKKSYAFLRRNPQNVEEEILLTYFLKQVFGMKTGKRKSCVSIFPVFE